jgi:hypothetical protein
VREARNKRCQVPAGIEHDEGIVFVQVKTLERIEAARLP